MPALRTLPLTAAVLIAILSAGAVTGTLYSAGAAGSPMVGALAYGPGALSAGRPEAFITGALLAPGPVPLAIMALLVAGCVGFLERRAGSLRTAAVLVASHLVATVGAAAALIAASTLGSAFGSSWAPAIGQSWSVGLSAGAIGVLAAATTAMHPVARSRVRWALGGFVAIMLLRSGSQVDLERVIGFAAGLAMGPIVAARPGIRPNVADHRRTRSPRVARIRGVVALLLILLPLSSVVLALSPAVGRVVGVTGVTARSGATAIPGYHGVLVGLVQLAIGVVIAKTVRRGLPGGWWAAALFCAVPAARAAVALVTGHPGGHPIGEMACWLAILALLIGYRRCWPMRLPAGTVRRHLFRLAVATAAFAGAWWVALTLAGTALGVDGPHRLPEILRRTALSGGAAHGSGRWSDLAVGLSGWIWACVLVVLLLPALHEARPADRRDPAADPMPAMLRRHGGGSLGWQRTWPGLSTWTNRAGDVAIGYRPVSGVAIVLGDPIGPAGRWADAVAEFRRFCLYAGWTVCWYAVTDEFRQRCGAEWSTLQIGEDAVITLPGLEFRGKTWQDVRTARNHAARDGIVMRSIAMEDVSDDLRAQILEVSRGWADEKPLPEMGFTLGTVEHARDRQMRTHIAIDTSGTVHGVTTWLPVHRDGIVVGWTLDVMRRRIGGFRPVIEFLIAESALAFQAEGYQTLSLSVAPLARCGDADRGATLDRVLDRFSKLLEPCYGFRSLLEFKRKFHPEFSPVYLGYADEMELTEISMAIGKAYLPHLTPRQALRVVRALYRGHRRGRKTQADPGQTSTSIATAGRSGCRNSSVPDTVAPVAALTARA